MFERFPRASRLVLERARDEAAVLGSKDLEAEHILLALTRDDDPVVRGVLSEAGLDRAAVRRALEAQDEAALGGVGISRAAFDLSGPAAHADARLGHVEQAGDDSRSRRGRRRAAHPARSPAAGRAASRGRHRAAHARIRRRRPDRAGDEDAGSTRRRASARELKAVPPAISPRVDLRAVRSSYD